MKLDITFWVVAIGLLAFGIVYNVVIAWLERNGYDRGFTALLVVAGVLITLAGFAVARGLVEAIYAVLLFVASGTPMVLGGLAREALKRAEAERMAVEEVKRRLIYLEGKDDDAA